MIVEIGGGPGDLPKPYRPPGSTETARNPLAQVVDFYLQQEREQDEEQSRTPAENMLRLGNRIPSAVIEKLRAQIKGTKE